MRAGHKPKPFELSDFAKGMKVYTGDPRWLQVAAWQREGKVSIKPMDDGPYATIILRDAVGAAVGCSKGVP